MTTIEEDTATTEREEPLKITLRTGDTVLRATLVDSPTTRDFISLLPLRVTVRDYAGTEKVGDLPRRLSTEGAPSGFDPSVGDITYYAPWGNLAIFHNDFGYAAGLVQLGAIESEIEQLVSIEDGSVVTIELAD